MLAYTTFANLPKENWVVFVHGAGGSSTTWFKQIKSFSAQFNVLLLDLRGHGKSKGSTSTRTYTFSSLSNDVLEVLDYLRIEKAHFVGISLGTILIRELAERYPKRVLTMTMGGAVLKLNFKSQILIQLGVIFKTMIPYILLYKLFAFIIMPRENHKESRLLFVREAKKLYQKEFIRWFKLASQVKPILKLFRMKDSGIPTLYVMGEEDHMFLPSIRKIVTQHPSSQLRVIPKCGHVVNLESPELFNQLTTRFISIHNI
ncbi:MAG: alpha/beta hydrolase [Schleiferiaceae bacterium]|jgi:pimeloyl-ACP methyl ester carboxylesterase|nr:alpha/beta hydrolase [Schleiferiaceae bacterium]